MSKKWFDLEEEARLAKKNSMANQQGKTRNAVKIVCPECGTKLYHEAGCIRCYSCGWTKC